MQKRSLTGKQWDLSNAHTPLASSAGLLKPLLESRGITAQDEAAYFAPSLAQLPDPLGITGVSAAIALLMPAIAERTPITVYGDYDVDGVCSTSILVDFMRRVGGNVNYYIPDRRSEGYGLNLAAMKEICATSKILITTDCGTTALPEVAAARQAGAEVIIVDHHQAGPELPQANALINPHQPDCSFAFKGLCAAGLAFMLVAALRRALRDAGHFRNVAEPDLRDFVDLAAVATVADMVPLRAINRTLVSVGLRKLAVTERIGLKALAEASDLGTGPYNASDIGFRLAPRINARGRLHHASMAVDLMLSNNRDEAVTLAKNLDDANRSRREVEQQVVEAAIQRVLEREYYKQAAIVVSDPSWHAGVVGLAATRLVSRFARPAVVIGESGKGSGRTFEGLDLHAALAEASSHTLRFGGHKAAAGVTIAPEKIEDFRLALNAAVESRLGPPPYTATLKPDASLAPDMWELSLINELQRMEPFGQGNPEPLFFAANLTVHQKRTVGEGDKHLKLTLGPSRTDAIGFGLGEHCGTIPPAVDVLFRLERNSWQGRDSAQLKIVDIRESLNAS